MSKGFAPILILVGIVVVALAVGGYLLYQNQVKPVPIVAPQPIAQTSTSPDETANWKTYTNTKYGYSIKYPNDWHIILPGKDGDKSINIQNYSESEITQQEQQSMSLNPDKLSVTIGVYDEKAIHSISLDNWLKTNGHYVSTIYGSPTSTEYIEVSGLKILKLLYQNSLQFYILSNGKNVFYVYYTPNNTSLINTFNQILSTFRFD
ncbi:MAG: hypothetical protein Q7R43_06075 [Candidatus Daviesbacteria bacterium]|nr:hypothetical protein [Candidatus Daviesbacteria bacterium]